MSGTGARIRRRALALGVAAAATSTFTVRAGAQTDAGPDIVKTLNEFFASQASADAKETLGWTKVPVPIKAGDPVDDQVALDPASEGYMPPSADVTGVSHARTGPLDDASFEALFGPEGALQMGAPRVYYPKTFTVDVNSFRQGMMITIIVPREPGAPPSATGEVFTVAVEAFDDRYPAPPNGTFAGINKAWRYDVTSAGPDVTYRQFDGTQFGSFQSPTAVLDTCTASAAAGGPGLSLPVSFGTQVSGGCFIAFFTALGGLETEGLLAIFGELYRAEGGQQAGDRANGAGLGEGLPTDPLEPGELGAVPVAPDPEPDPEPDPAPDPEPDPDPDPADDEAPAPDDAEATPAASDDGDGGNGAAIGLVAGGAAVAAGGTAALVAAKRRRSRRDAELKGSGYQGGPVHDGPTRIDPPNVPDLSPDPPYVNPNDPSSTFLKGTEQTTVVDAGDATEPPPDDTTGLA